jgi:hypothetical protein
MVVVILLTAAGFSLRVYRRSALRLILLNNYSWNGPRTLMCGRFSRSKAVFRVHSELRIASDEFSGHCLDLTLLGSYLSDAYNGDIHCRKEVSKRLAQDVRQGRARLLSGEYPRQREHLDTHPLVGEYFGEQLRRNR